MVESSRRRSLTDTSVITACLGDLGEFEPVRILAEGGMGVVYVVRSRVTGREFAAKIVRRPTPWALARFRREALLQSRCDRFDGVVKLRRFGETESGEPYMILELVDGISLSKLLAFEGPLSAARAVSIVARVARTLGDLHASGIVHRDVKPSNIMIDTFDRPWLTDFGLATSDDLEPLEGPHTFIGTPRYCAPEQVLSNRVGPAADVFALGGALFELLTGEVPFGAPTLGERLERIAARERSLPKRLAAWGHRGRVARAVLETLSPDPAERPKDGAALARLLERAASPTTMLPVPQAA